MKTFKQFLKETPLHMEYSSPNEPRKVTFEPIGYTKLGDFEDCEIFCDMPSTRFHCEISIVKNDYRVARLVLSPLHYSWMNTLEGMCQIGGVEKVSRETRSGFMGDFYKWLVEKDLVTGIVSDESQTNNSIAMWKRIVSTKGNLKVRLFSHTTRKILVDSHGHEIDFNLKNYPVDNVWGEDEEKHSNILLVLTK